LTGLGVLIKGHQNIGVPMLGSHEAGNAIQFNGNSKNIEMSRYIDLNLYHAIERSHAYYEEMIVGIKQGIFANCKPNGNVLNTLEIGVGTGILTGELLKIGNLQIDALDLDEECIKIHKHVIQDPKCHQLCDDAVTYCKPGHYDILVSAFAHDHIPYALKEKFAQNIKNNLKEGGIYIMGGEILPYYHDDESRKKSLYDYHCHIIDVALKNEHFELAQLEISALKSGIYKIGDFKRHQEEFEEEMASSGMKLISKNKMGPLDRHDIGGVFVYVYQKSSS